MTEKQENILKAALKLFAQEGYAATSTSKVAKAAGVSEGLIFRHFGNKEGLLKAILDQSREASRGIVADVIMTSDPKEMIRKLLELPFAIPKDQYEGWRLIYALKWQTNSYDDSYNEPLKIALKSAFEKLGYEDPAAEVEVMTMYMDGIVTAMILHEPEDKKAILKSLKAKYQL